MTVSLVVFDVDGTLVDSQANIIQAMTDTFARNGQAAPDHHAVRRVVGLSLVEAMQVLRPDAEPDLHEALAADYKTAFQRLRGAGLVEEPLFPGAREAIEHLAGAGVLLGVATGKSDRGLAKCLQAHQLEHHFITLQTADRHPSKPHPSMLQQAMADAGVEPDATLMLGDTLYDMAMARAAGTRALGVTWGYHEAGELLDAGAEALLDHFDGLHDWLSEQRR